MKFRNNCSICLGDLMSSLLLILLLFPMGTVKKMKFHISILDKYVKKRKVHKHMENHNIELLSSTSLTSVVSSSEPCLGVVQGTGGAHRLASWTERKPPRPLTLISRRRSSSSRLRRLNLQRRVQSGTLTWNQTVGHDDNCSVTKNMLSSSPLHLLQSSFLIPL